MPHSKVRLPRNTAFTQWPPSRDASFSSKFPVYAIRLKFVVEISAATLPVWCWETQEPILRQLVFIHSAESW